MNRLLCQGTTYYNQGIAKQKCYDCARTGTNDCGYDLGLLAAIFKDRDRTEGIHVTDLIGCLRRAYWYKTNPLPEYPYRRLTMTIGTLTHAVLEQAPSEVDIITEMPLGWEGIFGTCDAYYNNGRVVDYKTTRWLKILNLPYGEHALQVNVYGFLLKKMGYDVTSLAIQYIDMSGPTKCRKCRVPVIPQLESLASGSFTSLVCPHCGGAPRDAHLGAVTMEIPIEDEDELEGILIERRDILQSALDNQTVPEAEISFLCKGYCSYVYDCPEGQTVA